MLRRSGKNNKPHINSRSGLNNDSGVTLVELMVGLAIAAIFVTLAISLIQPVSNNYKRAEERSEAQMLANSLIEEIQHKTNLAKTLKVATGDDTKLFYSSNSDAISETNDSYISVDNEGYLVMADKAGASGERTEEKVYSAKFYNEKKIDIKFENTDTANKVKLTMTVQPKDSEAATTTLYTTTTILRPIISGWIKENGETVETLLKKYGVTAGSWARVIAYGKTQNGIELGVGCVYEDNGVLRATSGHAGGHLNKHNANQEPSLEFYSQGLNRNLQCMPEITVESIKNALTADDISADGTQWKDSSRCSQKGALFKTGSKLYVFVNETGGQRIGMTISEDEGWYRLSSGYEF